jgi:hypothetical protein
MCLLFIIVLNALIFAASERQIHLELAEHSRSTLQKHRSNLSALQSTTDVTFQVAVHSVNDWDEHMIVCLWTEYVASTSELDRSSSTCTSEPSGIYVIDTSRHGIYRINAAVQYSGRGRTTHSKLLSPVATLQIQVDCVKVNISQVPVGSKHQRIGQGIDVCDKPLGIEHLPSWENGVDESAAIARAQVRCEFTQFACVCRLTKLTK